MRRWHPVILFFFFVSGGIAGCLHTRRSEVRTHDDLAKVTFQVHGMMKAKSGATWMGWPDAVTESLEGINGTKQVSWDYARDRVTIRYDSRAAGPRSFAAAIAKLGYEAKPSTPDPNETARLMSADQVPIPADAPGFFVEALERARTARRPVVIDFRADWCVACLRLKRETLEHPDVIKALGSVEVIYVDLDVYPGLGEAYGVAAIPDVLFIDGSGRIADRLQNFEPPEAFVDRIREVSGRPSNRDTGHR